MPRQGGPAKGVTGPDKDSEGMVLLVMVVGSPEALDELVTAMLDYGVGGTMVDSKGLAAHLREEMPIFSGLAALLPQTTGSRMLFSVARREQATQVQEFIKTEMRHAQRPLAFTVRLDSVVGMRR